MSGDVKKYHALSDQLKKHASDGAYHTKVVLAADFDRVVAECERLRKALETMPDASLMFEKQSDRDAWNEWRDSVFDPDGNVLHSPAEKGTPDV